MKKRDLQIKTCPRIGLLLDGFWRAWRRLKADNLSFQTAPTSLKNDKYNVDPWPGFDFYAFLDIFCWILDEF